MRSRALFVPSVFAVSLALIGGSSALVAGTAGALTKAHAKSPMIAVVGGLASITCTTLVYTPATTAKTIRSANCTSTAATGNLAAAVSLQFTGGGGNTTFISGRVTVPALGCVVTVTRTGGLVAATKATFTAYHYSFVISAGFTDTWVGCPVTLTGKIVRLTM